MAVTVFHRKGKLTLHERRPHALEFAWWHTAIKNKRFCATTDGAVQPYNQAFFWGCNPKCLGSNGSLLRALVPESMGDDSRSLQRQVTRKWSSRLIKGCSPILTRPRNYRGQCSHGNDPVFFVPMFGRLMRNFSGHPNSIPFLSDLVRR